LSGGAIFLAIVVFPVLHKKAYDLIALLLKKPCRYRRVHPPGHPNYYLLRGRIVAQSLTGRALGDGALDIGANH
jgi:hypothetical protein